MSSARLTALALAVTTLIASGCGSSAKTGQLTRGELISKADVICAHFYVEYHAHGSKTPQEIVSKLPLLAAYEQTEVAELRKLKPPNSMASDWKQILDGTQTLATDTVRLGSYVKKHTLTVAQPLLSTSQRVEEKLFILARRDGLKKCAQLS